MIEKIKRYYELGFYHEEHLLKFLEKGVITEEQYNEIRGE